jgi:hypothetical protein
MERRRDETERIIANVDIEALATEASGPAVVELPESSRKLVEELSRLTVAVESTEDIEETIRRESEGVRSRHESAAAATPRAGKTNRRSGAARHSVR